MFGIKTNHFRPLHLRRDRLRQTDSDCLVAQGQSGTEVGKGTLASSMPGPEGLSGRKWDTAPHTGDEAHDWAEDWKGRHHK